MFLFFSTEDDDLLQHIMENKQSLQNVMRTYVDIEDVYIHTIRYACQ